MDVLRVQEIEKIYGEGENAVRALNGVSFAVEQGEFLAIVGTSGSGKSSLLNLLGGLDTPTGGRIWIRGRDIAELDRKSLTIFRRRNIGFVFQNYSLMPVLNVYDNVVLPVTFDKGKHVDHPYIEELLKELGLWEKRKKYPNELSGGQQQRVALARALSNKPVLILADEPTGNLDSRTTIEVMGLLKNSSRKYNQTILMVTHNEAIAQTCDRIIRIEDGRIVSGTESPEAEEKGILSGTESPEAEEKGIVSGMESLGAEESGKNAGERSKLEGKGGDRE